MSDLGMVLTKHAINKALAALRPPGRCPARTTASPTSGVLDRDPIRCALIAGHELPHRYSVSVEWFGLNGGNESGDDRPLPEGPEFEVEIIGHSWQPGESGDDR